MLDLQRTSDYTYNMNTAKTIIEIVIWSIIIIIISWTILYIGGRNQEEMFRIAGCVHNEAMIQEYAGNPYSLEAWKLFINKCN